MKIGIKSRWNGSILFCLECGSLEIAVEAAVKSGADLRGADLRGADLRGADLRGVNLRGADLGGADLRGADLGGADLYGADLRGADLRGANLRGADLGETIGKLVADRPVLQIGPIGSRSDYVMFFRAETGIFVSAGCFTGSLAEFEAAVKATHGESQHGLDYAAAIALVRVMWPATDARK